MRNGTPADNTRSAARPRRAAAAVLLICGALAPALASAIPIEVTGENLDFTGSAMLPFGAEFALVDTNIRLTESDTRMSTMDIASLLDFGPDPLAAINSFTITSTVSVELFPRLEFTTANPGETFGGPGNTLGDTLVIEPAGPLRANSVDQITVDLTATPGDGLTALELLFLILNDGLVLTEDNLTTVNVSAFSDSLDFELLLGESIGGNALENDVIKASVDGFTLGGVPLDADTLLAAEFDPGADVDFGIAELLLSGNIEDASVDPLFGPIRLAPRAEPVPVPAPATLALFGVALLPVLGAVARRRRRTARVPHRG